MVLVQLDPEMKFNSIMVPTLVQLLREDMQCSIRSLIENTNLNGSFLPKRGRVRAYEGYKLVLDDQYSDLL